MVNSRLYTGKKTLKKNGICPKFQDFVPCQQHRGHVFTPLWIKREEKRKGRSSSGFRFSPFYNILKHSVKEFRNNNFKT